MSTCKGPWAQLRVANSSGPLTYPCSLLHLSQMNCGRKHRSQLPLCWELQGHPGPEVPLPSLQGAKVPGGRLELRAVSWHLPSAPGIPRPHLSLFPVPTEHPHTAGSVSSWHMQEVTILLETSKGSLSLPGRDPASSSSTPPPVTLSPLLSAPQPPLALSLAPLHFPWPFPLPERSPRMSEACFFSSTSHTVPVILEST